MISFEEIQKHYSARENRLPRAVLKEYLQYKILGIIFSSGFGDRLVFMGGTAVRIIYNNDRFSEDLDIDNLGLAEKDFARLIELVRRELGKEGIKTEARNIAKGVYRCYLRFPRLLYKNRLSALPEEKILIQIDSFSSREKLPRKAGIINRVDVFSEVNVYPADIILSQKIFSLCKRPRAKGRDIYDIVYLFSLTSPNWQYLKKHLGVNNMAALKQMILPRFSDADLKRLAADVEPFLPDPGQKVRVEKFRPWLESLIGI